MRDTAYYDRESVRYSDKRYPAVASSYLQYFFLKRLEIVQDFLQTNVHAPVTLLEIGCADGVVIRAIARALPKSFSRIHGVDISPEMINEAHRRNVDPHTTFSLRNALSPTEQFDIVIEIGVVNYASVDEELRAARDHMHAGSLYILSIAGTDSLKNVLKGEDGFNDFRSYRTYQALIDRLFAVEAVRGCGVFVPYLWRWPRLARTIQPLVDGIFNLPPLRRFCHEQVYLLKKRAD